jgi:uncharacterized protein (TIGR01777 family)
MKVLATGMSGPIGAAVLAELGSAGYRITRMVRRPAKGSDEISWDPAHALSPERVSGFDAVIHLAGETIVGRWTSAKKQAIHDSRVLGTRNLCEALARAASKPRVLVSASAIGYYGDRGDQLLDEDSSPGSNFLAMVCREWESSTAPAANAGVRVVNLRFGVVLSTRGGALAKMLTPFRMGLGGNVGSGKQYWSWVSIDDVAGSVLHALTHDDVLGPVNVVAATPVTNREFTRALGAVLHRPTFLPMPAFAVSTAFGQMGDELLLASARVLPTKLLASGYSFRDPELRAALQKLLAR